MVKTIEFGDRSIGSQAPCFVIAEAGVNHNGDAELAGRLVVEAKRCGADCVKFQTFRAGDVVVPSGPKAPYQLETTDREQSQLAMLRRLELSPEAHRKIFRKCLDVGILYLSTPCNETDVDQLEDLGVAAYKVASFQAVEHEFLSYVARKGKPIFLSTGMASFGEVDRAVETIRAAGNERIVLLQCTTNYPSRHEDANLRAMKTMGRAFDVLTGYSDHTPGPAAAIASVALGAVAIEKHFTLNKGFEGPDHSSSADPEEFSALVQLIQQAQLALGSARKSPSAAERRNTVYMRRGLVAAREICKGAAITADMLALKRPMTGLAPDWRSRVVGRTAACDMPAGSAVRMSSIRWDEDGGDSHSEKD